METTKTTQRALKLAETSVLKVDYIRKKKKTTPSLIVLMVSVDVKQLLKKKKKLTSELRNCVKVEVAVLGSRP